MRMEEKAHMGQKIRTETGVDKSTMAPSKDMLAGKKMGGGIDNLSHTMKPGAYNDNMRSRKKEL